MNSLVPNPPPTALRLQPQTQTTLLSAPTAFEVSSKEDREQLSFFDIGITTGTDKVEATRAKMQRRFSFLKLDFTMEEGMICTGNFFPVGSVIQLKFLAYHMVLEKKESG